jgi:hypothetical protein
LPPAHIHLRVSRFFKSQSGTHFAWIIYVLIFFLETFIVLSRRGVHTLCLDHLYGYLFHPLCTLVLLTSLCTIQTWANSSISSPNSSSLPKHSEPFRPITGGEILLLQTPDRHRTPDRQTKSSMEAANCLFISNLIRNQKKIQKRL